MAISWQHTKGANCSTASGATTLYTSIEYSTASVGAATKYSLVPSIFVASANFIGSSAPSGAINLGRILTSNIDNMIDGSNKMYFGGTDKSISNDSGYLFIDGDTKFSDAATFDTSITTLIGNITSMTASSITGSSATINGPCQANYFNAMSDRRMKTNEKIAEFSALEIVKNLPIYTFNYKDIDASRSFGIMAQDIQDVEIDGFTFVENKEAKGVEYDYMSLRESKLIYLLLKAIQEQQKEIEELKAKCK